MKEKKRDKEGLPPRMKLPGAEERGQSNRLFVEAIPVWYSRNGQVNPEWLSACGEERNLTESLMEQIACPLNLSKAYQQVRSNGGSAGVDDMKVEALQEWLGNNLSHLQEQLLKGNYQPQMVRGIQIPKPGGGKRQLGIPTVTDRLVQQSIHQVLSARYEKIFSENSYGFRPDKNAHQALRQAGGYVAAGKGYVIDLDLEKFFDEVNHHRLMWLLSTRIGDKRVLQLIYRYLKVGMLQEGLTEQRIKGTPQGSPLSPLLSNIVLDELDKELEQRGHSYVRYADDVKIFAGSKRRAEEVKASITKYIIQKLKLKVNESKSRICKGYELNFLGHSILPKGEVGLMQTERTTIKRQGTRSNEKEQGYKPLRNAATTANKTTGMAQLFSLRQNEQEDGSNRRMDQAQAKMLQAQAMQANDRHSTMATEIRRSRKAKLANGTKWEGVVAVKQQSCAKHWYEQNVVYPARLLQLA